MSFAVTPYGILKTANVDNYDLSRTTPMQQFMPIQNRRNFSAAEQDDIRAGKDRWLPKIFQSYGTPATQMMSSPLKGGVLTGLGITGAGALLGALLSAKGGNPYAGAMGGAALGAGFGVPAGLMTYLGRRQNNENIEELLRRLPSGATKRDILADPVYQKDLDRKLEAQRHFDNHMAYANDRAYQNQFGRRRF